MADLWPPVVGAHDYVLWPRARWTTASVGLHFHTGPLRVSLARCKLGPAVTSQLLQHHGAPPAFYLGRGQGGGLRCDAPHHSISW
jgi:hypothetical protein